MVVSQDEQKIAVAIGTVYIKEIREIEAIIVYKFNPNTGKF